LSVEVANRPSGRLGAATEPGFRQDAGDMVLDGLSGDEQPVGNLAVGEAPSKQGQHLTLSTRQGAGGGRYGSAGPNSERTKECGCCVGVADRAEAIKRSEGIAGLGDRARWRCEDRFGQK
jgi:hypothetical protein